MKTSLLYYLNLPWIFARIDHEYSTGWVFCTHIRVHLILIDKQTYNTRLYLICCQSITSTAISLEQSIKHGNLYNVNLTWPSTETWNLSSFYLQSVNFEIHLHWANPHTIMLKWILFWYVLKEELKNVMWVADNRLARIKFFIRTPQYYLSTDL